MQLFVYRLSAAGPVGEVPLGEGPFTGEIIKNEVVVVRLRLSGRRQDERTSKIRNV